jgi:tetratricopeptide (TPR) repeat protein
VAARFGFKRCAPRFLPGYLERVSARARIIVVTTAAAVLAAVGAVAVGALQGERPGEASAAAAAKPREGAPPLGLDLGVRDDPEARALRRAERLYVNGDLAGAKVIFDRHDSLEARVGSAFASWPTGTRERLEQLAGLHPDSAVVQLHLGIARTWAGTGREREAWQAAADAEPDTAYRVTADNLLYPDFARGIPIFVTTAPLPAGFDDLSPARQLAVLEQEARSSADGKLLYGAALQRLGRQLSAQRVFAAAARAEPGDAEAQVAAAVGRFSKSRPADAFSRLGPLTRRFPGRSTVRFHLGVLLLWSGQVDEAKRQLALAQRAEPGSPLADEAAEYLAELRKAGI